MVFCGELSTYAVLELKQHYDVQVKELVGSHQRELTQLRDDHKVEISRMQKVLEVVSLLKYQESLFPCVGAVNMFFFVCFFMSFTWLTVLKKSAAHNTHPYL